MVAAGAGAFAALGFEPWNFWSLTIVAVAVLIALVDGAVSRGRAALIGWAFGAGHFTAGLGRFSVSRCAGSQRCRVSKFNQPRRSGQSLFSVVARQYRQ